MIVLDTNVLSELMRPSPDAAVNSWSDTVPVGEQYISVVTVAEVRYGIARLPRGRRREALQRTADRNFATFRRRTLTLDPPAAALYGDVVVERTSAGKPVSTFDALLAAIVRSHDATLATRNTDDFTGLGLDLVNPWEHPAG